MKKCAVRGCGKNSRNNQSTYFFGSPLNDKARRDEWISVTGKNYSEKARFYICQDHFDVVLTYYMPMKSVFASY